MQLIVWHYFCPMTNHADSSVRGLVARSSVVFPTRSRPGLLVPGEKSRGSAGGQHPPGCGTGPVCPRPCPGCSDTTVHCPSDSPPLTHLAQAQPSASAPAPCRDSRVPGRPCFLLFPQTLSQMAFTTFFIGSHLFFPGGNPTSPHASSCAPEGTPSTSLPAG